MKTIYFIVWFLSMLIFMSLVLIGYFRESTLIFFGLIGLASLYSLPLWTVYKNPRKRAKLEYKMYG